MAFEEFKAEISLLFQQMENQPEDPNPVFGAEKSRKPATCPNKFRLTH